MKISIDTKEDSAEDLKKVITMLEALVHNKKVYSNSYGSNSGNIFDSPNSSLGSSSMSSSASQSSQSSPSSSVLSSPMAMFDNVLPINPDNNKSTSPASSSTGNIFDMFNDTPAQAKTEEKEDKDEQAAKDFLQNNFRIRTY